jgi:protocatechuate 3,4-dioxygenase beta subunit
LERKWTFGTLTPQASIPMKSVENMTGQTFLRGCQITDSNGAVTFKTIVPGWHSGRTIHIHVMIRTFSSTGTALTEFTTRLFFDQKLTDALATSVSPYSSRGLPDTMNAEDSIYSNSTQLSLANAATGEGYISSITLEVQTA